MATAFWTWGQHVMVGAISLGAAVWLIRRAFTSGGKGPCASCGLQRTMTKRPVRAADPAAPTRTK